MKLNPRNTPVRKCIKLFKVVTNVDLVDVQALVQTDSRRY